MDADPIATPDSRPQRPRILGSLSIKVALGLALLLCLIAVPSVITARYFLDRYMLEVTQELNRPLAAFIAEDVLAAEAFPVDAASIEHAFNRLMMINPAVELYLLDVEGGIVGFSAPADRVLVDRVSLAPIERHLQSASPRPTLGDDPRNPDRQKIFSAAPVERNGGRAGYVYVVLGGERLDELSQALRGSYVLTIAGWSALGLLVFAIAAAALLARLLTGRLRKLAREMDLFRQRVFPRQPARAIAARAAGDEIARLTAVFHEMSAHIQRQLDSLQQTDNMRSTLVANLAHDLKTPLASVQGYLETLVMKEGHLDTEQRRSYLDTALKATRRLNRLTNQLLELAKLEFQETQLRREPFALGELVQDIVQQFEAEARARNVQIGGEFTGALPFVAADIGLIERVLFNLIDNAIRYAPDGGHLRIDLDRDGDGVRVQVCNTEGSLAREDLPGILNPPYRDDGARHGGQGSGLGLAIVARILELHGSRISVEADAGGPTVFSFRLPAVIDS